MRIHDYRFPESASFERKEQGVREEGRGEKKNTDRPEGQSVFLVGEDGFEPSKALPADLQSVPFGHSGIPPYTILSEGGAGRRTRTPDLLITNQLLYQLSYTSTTPAYVS